MNLFYPLQHIIFYLFEQVNTLFVLSYFSPTL